MHLSMHNWMRAEPIAVTVRRLARYGYKSIELSGEPEIYNTKEVRGLLSEYGLSCWGRRLADDRGAGPDRRRRVCARQLDRVPEQLCHDGQGTRRLRDDDRAVNGGQGGGDGYAGAGVGLGGRGG